MAPDSVVADRMLRYSIPGLVVVVLGACSTPGPAVPEPARPDQVAVVVVELKYALAAEIVELAAEVMGNRVFGGAGAGQDRLGTRPRQPRVMAQPGTNALVLEGNADELREMLEVIKRLDVQARPFDADPAWPGCVYPIRSSSREVLGQFTPDGAPETFAR